jgi:hypothetical protein
VSFKPLQRKDHYEGCSLALEGVEEAEIYVVTSSIGSGQRLRIGQTLNGVQVWCICLQILQAKVELLFAEVQRLKAAAGGAVVVPGESGRSDGLTSMVETADGICQCGHRMVDHDNRGCTVQSHGADDSFRATGPVCLCQRTRTDDGVCARFRVNRERSHSEALCNYCGRLERLHP